MSCEEEGCFEKMVERGGRNEVKKRGKLTPSTPPFEPRFFPTVPRLVASMPEDPLCL